MTEEEIKLQNALTQTFLTNLAFLKEYDNLLYQRVENLSLLMESGQFKSRYDLELIKENGDFDIYDKFTDSYLYNKTPKKINNELIKDIEKDGKKSIFNVEKYFAHKTNPTIDLDYKYKGEFEAMIYDMALEYSKALNEYLENYKNKKYKSIIKFAFFGVFLGRHIIPIAKKINAPIYLIVENNLEIFRLSLFTTNYSLLALNSKIIFSVMEDLGELEEKIEDFLTTSHLENYLIKFSLLGDKANDKYNILSSHVYMRNPSTYNFTRWLYSYIFKTTEAINNKYKFLLFNKIQNSLDIFKDIPILYLAAGPSLDKNLDWIKANQNKFFIVAIASVYNKLLNSGVKVDLVTTADEQKWLKRVQFPDDLIKKIEPNTTFFASAFTTQETLKSLKDKNLFIFESYKPFFKDNYCFSGFSVGEISLEIILKLNAKNIFLIGLDLSLNQETGDTHSSGAASGVSKINLEKDNQNENMAHNSIVNVRGNLFKSVKTIEKLYGSIKEVERKLSLKQQDVNIYNLSQNGAFFEGTTPLELANIDINSFKNIDKENLDFKSIMEKFSKTYLDDFEKSIHKSNIDFLKSNTKESLNYIKNQDFKNYDEFNQYIIDLIEDIEKNNLDIFYRVLLNYYEIVIPYLNYYFNDVKINQEFKKLQKIKNIFASQVEGLIDDYIYCIKRVI